ncbi:cytochrome b5-like isoform X2 [Watersipora subatra]
MQSGMPVDVKTDIMSQLTDITRLFSRTEVSNHASYDSCWVIIDNDVYDVTTFLKQHPGGDEILLEHAGSDCTTAFQEKGHSAGAVKLLAKYKIGVLREEEMI